MQLIQKKGFQEDRFYSRWDSLVQTESVGVNGAPTVAEILHIATYAQNSNRSKNILVGINCPVLIAGIN